MHRLFPLQHSQHAPRLRKGRRGMIDVDSDAVRVHDHAGPRTAPRVHKRVMRKASVFLVVVFAVFLGRVLYLQAFQGDTYRAVAENNRVRTFVTKATRGVVYDRFGIQLVENAPSFTLTITPGELPEDPNERAAVFSETYDLTGMYPADIDELLTEFPPTFPQPVPVQSEIPYETALALMVRRNLPGVGVEMSTLRKYVSSPQLSLSHLLGYTGIINQEEFEARSADGYQRNDIVGKQGIESYYESVLRGTYGERVVEVDASGRELVLIEDREPVQGSNVHLHVDLELTNYIESRLTSYFAEHGFHRSSVVVLDPRNGGVLSLVSLPSYDNNAFSRGIRSREYQALIENESRPLFPRAFAGEFPPGSTFKSTVAAIALNEGIISSTTSFVSSGGIAIGPWFFPDWRAGGHGVTNVRKAIADSVNTFFYAVGGGWNDFQGLGIETISQESRAFGYGSPTGIDLFGEADGFLPTKDWKLEAKGERWYIGDTYNASIGQGDVLVTPLQVANATAIIANGGTYYAPRLLQSIELPNGNRKIEEPTVVNEQVVPETVINIVREGMRDTVRYGSARSLQSVPMNVAGKTGTAQTFGDRENHGWFTSFAPFEDPQFVVTVLIEESGGSDQAVPIARDIHQWLYQNRIDTGENER